MVQKSLFISDNDEFDVKFAVATDQYGNIFCDINEETLKKGIEDISDDPENYEICSYTATFKRPSFADLVDLYDSVFSTVDGANVRFNPIAARYRKIALLIKSWDLTGKKESPTVEQIKKLHPAIAAAIGIQLDMETGNLLQ